MTAPASFRLAYVPGVTPAKWVRTWRERLPEVPLTLVRVTATEAQDAVRGRDADAALLRLPVDRTDLHAIPLYTETTVVVVPKDHFLAAADELSEEELADEIVLHPLDDVLAWESLPGKPALERPASTEDAVELVSAGVGLVVLPQSLARLHHRKDLTYRPLLTAPASQVALSWLAEETSDLMEQFIGIVRGRTVNSSRGAQAEPAKPEKPAAKRPLARKKPAAQPRGKGKPRRR
ncbi:LysR family transcriptional regulator substrate-binding protein [Kutzneria buriramensis]|uniref:LysR substrate binding domain-containing protein n=1 Tax=Kutzneria buriramensis TaxID=1045776 RepID=A0A3E0H315_9PSEU|nr:LysR family transcriptional regulator substrate-binding protein [Kutzneria buriramensis]REH37246.1 LysR substrate binding domain-containing protein [Kutzneria buriramensis]